MTTTLQLSHERPGIWPRCKRWLVNGLIVLLLGFAIVQGMPLKMQAATNRVRWLADLVGIGHEEWNMYAPSPDRQNHRVSAEVLSSFEHVAGRWSMPNWRGLSTAERFRLHRWSEYYDHVWLNYNSLCWPALAQRVVRETNVPPDEELRQVKLMVESKSFPPPTGNRWPPPVPPDGYDDKWVLWIEQLHLGQADAEEANQP
jgi:hypothetical protein